MDILPFEIVLVIASADPLTFALMIQASSKVNNYIKTPTGRRCFLASCRKKQDSAICKKTYLMFTDRLHSFFDKPAYTTISNITLQYKNDLPLIICNVEEQLWYQNGLKHRDNNPAVIRVNGIQVWYQYGKTHRTDGPALIYADGSTEWWIEGMRHRIDGPAIINMHGRQVWYKNGKKHRDDGPAIIESNGDQFWFKNGKRYREGEITATRCIGVNENQWASSGRQ